MFLKRQVSHLLVDNKDKKNPFFSLQLYMKRKREHQKKVKLFYPYFAPHRISCQLLQQGSELPSIGFQVHPYALHRQVSDFQELYEHC